MVGWLDACMQLSRFTLTDHCHILDLVGSLILSIPQSETTDHIQGPPKTPKSMRALFGNRSPILQEEVKPLGSYESLVI